jgi:hypothetical protein
MMLEIALEDEEVSSTSGIGKERDHSFLSRMGFFIQKI